MTRASGMFTVACMTSKSDDRNSSAARRPLTDNYDNLRGRNERRADLARARELAARIERTMQAARQRATRNRG